MGLMAGTHPNAASRRPIVAVIGASLADDATSALAAELGRAISREEWHLLTGGGGGVMEAACRGFREARHSGSGQVIGILPTDNAEFANNYNDIVIPTGMGIARNAIIARTADALIAVGGCAGTLSEMALAWQLGRPIVACARSGGWAEKLAGAVIDGRFPDPVYAANNTNETISFVKSKLKSQGK